MKMLNIRKIESNGNLINNEKDWLRYAPPKEKDQWKKGHSAQEFSSFILEIKNNSFVFAVNPEAFENAIKECTNCNEFDVYPEYKTELETDGFDFYNKNGRQHDGLMVGSDIVIGIEAKATEPLDSYLGDKPIYDEKPSHKKRYHDMTRAITGKTAFECEKLRYQLLSGTAGTVIEAHKRGAKKALFLLITLKTDLVKNQMIERNERDIKDFIKFLKKEEDGSYHTQLSDSLGVKLFIKHIVVEMK